ncbi:50S rRNA methyltransferase, partial [Streptomyces sp. SID6013]|nr:50S rRNA methyltransferase [Streptomyces sp. SID6013]
MNDRSTKDRRTNGPGTNDHRANDRGDGGDRMTTPWGEHVLSRYPEDARDRLRAWDASDEYLLGHLAERDVPLDGTVV